MDVIDLAGDLEELQRDQALKACLARRDTGCGRQECVDCDAPIPVARQQALPSVQRCMSCQEDMELRGRTR